MTIEDRIAALRQQKSDKPFCWLICFEERPLQGIPPGGSGPHLMVFTSAAKAHDFIKGRKKFYGSETLSTLALDSAITLKELSIGTAEDKRYAPPPCGVVVDFQYPSGRSSEIITTTHMKDISTDELTNRIHMRSNPPLPGQRKVKFAWSRQTKAIAIGISAVVALLIVFFILRGVFLGMKSGKIKPLSFMNTPTLTPTVTPTATATQKPWQVHITDDFSSNKLAWWLVQDDYSEYCGSESTGIAAGKFTWTVIAIDGCVWYQYPDLLPVQDFEAYVDIERQPDSATGDMGMTYRIVDEANYTLFLIDPMESNYSVFGLADNEWRTLIDWTTSNAIYFTGVNRVGIKADGTTYTFYINGKSVATIIDTKFSSGKVGLGLGIHNAGDYLNMKFDNFDLFSNR